MASDSSARMVLFNHLADEFVERYRQGERPSLQEYIERHPELAADIREFFPALIEIEQVKDDRGEGREASVSAAPPLQQVGDYRILREIGRGGMGVVYEAVQISLGRPVALKILPCQATRDDKVVERFRREARAAARLHHTNIVPVFEVGVDGESCYYAMQLILGQSLDQVVAELRQYRTYSGRRPPGQRSSNDQRPEKPGARKVTANGARSAVPALSQPAVALLTGQFQVQPPSPTELYLPVGADAAVSTTQAVATSTSAVLPGQTDLSSVQSDHHYFQSVARIGQQTAAALAYAHERGIIHRDIKPSNLLLDSAGVVWITDFGLAKTDDEGLTNTGDIVGTLRYMAPERFNGHCDARADIYALGATLYELLVFQPVFDSPDRLRLLKQVQSQEPLRPRTLDPRIPRDLETIVLTAMNREPQRRYHAAQDMSADLGRFLAGEPIRARPVGELERLWKWAERNPWVAGLLAAIVLVLVSATAVSLSFAFEARHQEKKTQDALAVAKGNAAEANRQLALAQLNHGLGLCEQGEASAGLHWLLESLKTAPAEDAALRHTVRANLSAWRETAPALRFLLRQTDLRDARYSPDGNTLATTGQDGMVRIWDAETGALIRTLSHPDPVHLVSFSSDGKTILTAMDRVSSTVSLWDTANGRLLGSFQPPGKITAAIFTPDGQKIVTGTTAKNGRGELRIWDAHSREPSGPPIPQEAKVDGLSFLADGHTILVRWHWVWEGTSYQLTDLATGQPVGKAWGNRPTQSGLLPGDTFLDHETWQTDSPSLTLRWRDLLTGKERRANPTTRGAGNTYLKSLSPDGQTCWFGSPVGRVDWRDTGTGRLLGSFLARTGHTRVFSTNGDLCVIGDDSRGSMAGVWQVPRTVIPNAETVASILDPDIDPRKEPRFQLIAFSPDHRQALLGGWGVNDNLRGGTARLVETTTGRPIGPPLRHPWEHIRCVAFSPNGEVLATGCHPPEVGGGVQLWDARGGQPLHPLLPLSNWPSALAFSPDGKLLATGDFHGLVKLWDVSTGKLIGGPLSHKEIVLSLAFSPDGKTLAAGTSDDHNASPHARLWDVVTGQPRGNPLPNSHRVVRVTFSPDGRALLTISLDGRVFRWDTATTKMLGELQPQTLGSVMPAAFQDGIPFSPDGRTFLIGNKDGMAHLWDTATGQPLRGATFPHSSAIRAAAYSPDGRLAVIGCEDGLVRLWDLDTFKPVGPPRALRQRILGVAFTSDGRFFSAVDSAGYSRAWPVPTPVDDTDLARLTLQLQVHTGLQMDGGQEVALLDAEDWEKRRQELVSLEGAAGSTESFKVSAADFHDASAGDAEEAGNHFAALWHLDRLIAQRPGDWLPVARRARLHSDAGRFTQAAADYARAQELGGNEVIQHWYQHRALDCRLAKRFATAQWYLDRMGQVVPNDWSVYRDRADLFKDLGKPDPSEAALEKAVQLGGDASVVLRLAEILARQGKWPRTAALIGQLRQKEPGSLAEAHLHVLALLKAGDVVGYRAVCTGLARSVKKEAWSPGVANSVAWLCSLGPGAVEDFGPIAAMAEEAVLAAKGPGKHLVLNTLGAVLYRAKRYPEALDRLNEGIASQGGSGVVQDWVLLAMVHHRLGKPDQAQKWLSKAAVPTESDDNHFWENVEIDLLRREAMALIEAKKDSPTPSKGEK